MNDPVMTVIENAVEGLIYMSESDHAFEVIGLGAANGGDQYPKPLCRGPATSQCTHKVADSRRILWRLDHARIQGKRRGKISGRSLPKTAQHFHHEDQGFKSLSGG